jgi:hypothetical protein
MKTIIITLLFLFTLVACERNIDGIVDLTEQVKFNGDYFPERCYSILFLRNKMDGVIITDNESYLSFADSLKHTIGCDSANPAYIDFNNYSLIGKYTIGTDCGDAEFKRQIYDDKKNKKIIYKITVQYSPLPCKVGIYSMNWALIPKIKNNYRVEFQVNEIK